MHVKEPTSLLVKEQGKNPSEVVKHTETGE